MGQKLVLSIVIRLLIFYYKCYKCQVKGENFMAGLHERLVGFMTCNVRITAPMEQTYFEPFTVPVALLDVERRNYVLSTLARLWGMTYSVDRVPRQLFPFKHRENRCSLDLIVHLGDTPYDVDRMYNYRDYGLQEYVTNQYMISIRPQDKFWAEDQQSIWEKQEIFVFGISVFIWTTLPDSKNESSPVHRLRFEKTFLISRICVVELNNCTVHVSKAEEPTQNSSLLAHMANTELKARKSLFWSTTVPVNFRKLRRGVQLPADERNLERDPSPEFYVFMGDLIDRSNLSQETDMHFFLLEIRNGFGIISRV